MKDEKENNTASSAGIITRRMEADEASWDSTAEYIQVEMLGFCWCGAPEDNLKYVMNGLSHIDKGSYDGPNRSEWYQSWGAEGALLFGSEGSKRFFFYWADNKGFTEHGIGIPGWLTEEGKILLGALNELDGDEAT